MTDFSVFTAANRLTLLTLQEALAQVTGPLGNQLVQASMTENRPALIGLGNEEAIIKPSAAGDLNLRFNDLYDVAITIHDLERMRQVDGHSAQDVATRYVIKYRLPLLGDFPVQVSVWARTQMEARDTIYRALDETPSGAKVLSDMIAAAVANMIRLGVFGIAFDDIAKMESGRADMLGSFGWLLVDGAEALPE